MKPTTTAAIAIAATLAAVTATATTSAADPARPADIGDRVLVGYLHTTFANGSGYVPISDAPSEWDFINLSFGESEGDGVITFDRCDAAECPNRESDEEFKAGIAAAQEQGKKVLLSIGGANGTVSLTDEAARDNFVSSVGGIVDEYGLDGIDIDFEGHSLWLDDGDRDIDNPTTPVIVNLIDALRTLTADYGDDFVLTMAPETFFVQVGYQFYGSGEFGGADPRAGSYLPVINALRDQLTLLHVQHYNSGPILGLDDQYHTMGTADFHVAMADMVLAGFPIEGDEAHVFEPLRPDQVAIGLPASTEAGNGHTPVPQVQEAVGCLTGVSGCDSYQPVSTYPAMRGLMAWSINWDVFNGNDFAVQHRAYLDSLPA